MLEPTIKYQIDNAGLTILHLFIIELFLKTELTSNSKFTHLSSQQKAAHILTYLVNGNKTDYILDNTLNKILCGLQITSIIDDSIQLSDEQKNMCEDILEKTIKACSKFNNISINNFRESLLQSPGAITFENDRYILQIENQILSKLAEFIPWSISLVYLPWMIHPLHVCFK